MNDAKAFQKVAHSPEDKFWSDRGAEDYLDDPAIHEYCFVEVTNHLNKVFKGTGFFPERLVDCE